MRCLEILTNPQEAFDVKGTLICQNWSHMLLDEHSWRANRSTHERGGGGGPGGTGWISEEILKQQGICWLEDKRVEIVRLVRLETMD